MANADTIDSYPKNEIIDGDTYFIKIVKQPPEYVYSEQWFDVALAIERTHKMKKNSKSISVDINVGAYLSFHTHAYEASGDIFCNGALIVTNPEIICMSLGKSRDKSKATKVRCKIKSPLYEDKLAKYLISFSPTSTKPSSISSNISFGSVTPIQIISAKIVHEGTNLPDVWYKDEGGKDKRMKVKVSLINVNGDIVRDRRIPLNITLLYDNEQSTKVLNQETLRIMDSSEHSIDPRSGECCIYFRIEEVSKNHQGQNFKLEIAPDMSKVFDVGSTCTTSVCIRSKRKKRRRPSNDGRAVAFNSSDSVHKAGGYVASTIPSTNEDEIPPNMCNVDKSMGLSGVKDAHVLKQAMKGFIEWTEEIVNGLVNLKWALIGYAQLPDGSLDYGRPYHSMSNPNEYIMRVLSMYSERTIYHLQTLKSAVESIEDTGSQGFQQVIPPHSDQTSQMPFGRQNNIDEMMNVGKQFSMGNMNQNGMCQLPSQQLMSPGQNAQQDNMSQFTSPVIGQYTGLPHQFQHQRSSNERMFNPYHHMGPIDSSVKKGGGSRHHNREMHMMNRTFSEDLERIQDGKVEEEIVAGRVQKTIEYILAKLFRSARKGTQLGFPAFNSDKVIVGFYRESTMKVGVGRFVLLSKYKDEIGPREKAQSTLLLEDEIKNKSRAVHTLQDWGSLQSMIGNALVYAWSNDLSHGNNGSPNKGTIDI